VSWESFRIWLEGLQQLGQSESFRQLTLWLFFFYSVLLGLRLGLAGLFGRRKIWLVDLPDGRNRAFAPNPIELPLLVGALLGSCIRGLLRPWTALAILCGGLVCGAIPAILFSLALVARMKPKRALLWTIQLRRIGWRSEALSVLEAYAGLETGDYARKERMTARLHGRLGSILREEPLFVLVLADTLAEAGRLADAVPLLEAILGIDEDAYERPGTFPLVLQNLGAWMPPEAAMKYLLSLAGALGAAGKPAQALAALQDGFGSLPWSSIPEDVRNPVLITFLGFLEMTGQSEACLRLFESFLGLPGGDYTDPALAAGFIASLQKLKEDDRIVTGALFATGLSNNQRDAEARYLLSAWLQVRWESEDLAASMTFLDSLPLPAKAQIAQLIVSPWTEAGRPRPAVALLERALGLTSSDYSSSKRLYKRLQRLPISTAGICVVKLAGALAQGRRHRDALALLTSFLWLSPRKYRNEAKLRRDLDARLQPLPAEIRAGFFIHLVYRLRDAGRSAAALRLAQAFLGIAPDAWADPERIAGSLTERLAGMSLTVSSQCLDTFVELLEGVRRPRDASLILDIWLILWVCPGDPDAAAGLDPTVFCSMFDKWLSHFGLSGPASEVCRLLLPRLRQSLAETAVTLEDRIRFVTATAGLRRRLVEVGLGWAEAEADAGRAAEIRFEILLWDLELGQRILLERFLAGPREAAETEGDLTAGWSLGPPSDALPFPLLRAAEPSPAALSLVEKSPLPRAPEAGAAPAAPLPAWLEEARDLVQRGLTPAELARGLPASTVFVRALFLDDGRLAWIALGRGSQDGSLEILAHGTGEPRDRFQVRWQNAVHDFRIAAAWSRLTVHPRRWARAVTPLLREIHTGLAKAAEPARLAALADPLAATARKHGAGKEISARLGNLARLILQDHALLTGQPHLVAASWNALSDLVAGFQQAPAQDPRLFDRERDRITADYLREVAAVWRLDPLAGHLDPAATDLVFQLDDALHEVPMAHLPIAGLPLFRRVRSVRQSLSVLLTEIQQEIERQAPDPGPRLMTVSWFEDADRLGVHRGNVLLHRGQAELAERFAMDWYSAGVEPPGRAGSVRAGLERYGGFRAVTLCGHGHPDLGVKLADPEPWRGQGCPLDQVELLILVSCSVGSLRENGTRDVEGLVVELAIHRARAVLACRWPVHSCAAPVFANEVIARYLDLRTGLDPDTLVFDSCLRARALNAARQAFLGEDRGAETPVGLDTVAAFELYGLG
jgi:tetratricopeptide (TPR) repeat protein